MTCAWTSLDGLKGCVEVDAGVSRCEEAADMDDDEGDIAATQLASAVGCFACREWAAPAWKSCLDLVVQSATQCLWVWCVCVRESV